MHVPSTYEIKYTKDGRACGAQPDFPTLAKALKDADGYHGAMLVTYDEAVTIVKSRRVRQFAIRYQVQAPSRSTPGYGRDVYGSLWVSRKQALELVRSAYHYCKDNVLVEMNLHGDAIFIG